MEFRLWYGQLKEIISDYKEDQGQSDALYPDEIEELAKALQIQMNYLEGNITHEEEARKLLELEKGK